MRTCPGVALGLFLGMTLAGCVVGAPPTFSGGDSWTLPLVDPLADGRLVTPVMVDGKGPFLFAIDPDAPETTADRALAGIVGVPTKPGARLTDEHDTTHPTWRAPLPNVKIGTLDISLMTFQLVENNQYNAEGRRIWGVLGRDIIADSLVFTIDRDRGVARLTVSAKYTPPPGAQVLPYKKLVGRSLETQEQLPSSSPRTETTTATGSPSSTRFLVAANVNGKTVDLHLDLGDVPSQLAPARWNDAQLVGSEWTQELVDELGTHRIVTQDAIAAHVTVGTAGGAPLVRDGIGFVAYDDRRWLSGQIDGTLGLDFFRPFTISADWQHERFLLTPRPAAAALTAERIARWGASSIGGCKIAGCATAVATTSAPAAPLPEVTDGAPASEPAPPPPPAAPRTTLHIERDPALAGHNLEVVLAATAADGKPLPTIYVDLDARTSTLDAPIEARYAGAQLTVADLSPFPRACPNHAPSCARLVPPVAP